MADTLSALYPGLLALAAIAGLRLAWSWYHRIAERPMGPAPAPFTAFSFNDQMVWGLVIGVALLLLPLPGVRVVGDNVVLVWAALYTVRGMAVFAAVAGRVPAPVLAALAAVTLLLLPFVRTWWTALVALLPTIALVALGASAWQRGAARGVWLAPWEIVLLFLALALAFLGLGGRAGGRVQRKAKAKHR